MGTGSAIPQRAPRGAGSARLGPFRTPLARRLASIAQVILTALVAGSVVAGALNGNIAMFVVGLSLGLPWIMLTGLLNASVSEVLTSTVTGTAPSAAPDAAPGAAPGADGPDPGALDEFERLARLRARGRAATIFGVITVALAVALLTIGTSLPVWVPIAGAVVGAAVMLGLPVHRLAWRPSDS